VKRQQRREFRRDDKRRRRPKPERTHITMLAREKWQIKTIAVLERVFEERCKQMAKHGEAMRHLPDGTGPGVQWIPGLPLQASEIETLFRREYDEKRGDAPEPSERLTRMHLVREELAEAFEKEGDDPEFVDEILQVAALCVQWAEYKIGEPGLYRGYKIRIGSPHSDGVVQIWDPRTEELITRTTSTDRAERIIDDWQNAV
jgi:hypothetical protein